MINGSYKRRLMRSFGVALRAVLSDNSFVGFLLGERVSSEFKEVKCYSCRLCDSAWSFCSRKCLFVVSE